MANTYPEEPTTIEYDPSRARRSALSAILLLLLILLTLLLIAAATERTDILRFAGILIAPGSYMMLQPRLGAVSATQILVVNIPAQPTSVVIVPQSSIDPSMQAAYDRIGGLSILGLPISPLGDFNGRKVQWFERGRLELNASTIESALVGVEYTQGIQFPQQQPFTDRPGARFFPQSQHGLTEPFLSAWERAGAVQSLGYPISEQVQEVLSDGVIYTVQYFERGRLEHHPAQAGTPAEFQLGLLGRALLLKETGPKLITPPKPTLVVSGQ